MTAIVESLFFTYMSREPKFFPGTQVQCSCHDTGYIPGLVVEMKPNNHLMRRLLGFKTCRVHKIKNQRANSLLPTLEISYQNATGYNTGFTRCFLIENPLTGIKTCVDSS